MGERWCSCVGASESGGEMVECGGGRMSWKLKKAAKKILLQTCGSFSSKHHNRILDTPINSNTNTIPTVASDLSNYDSPCIKPKKNTWSGKSKISSEIENATSNKSACAICLDPLNYSSGSSPGQAIFTAQCSHSFHFNCISSNVRHGNVTCPICRAQWTQLPHNLNARRAIHQLHNRADPVLQILDDSIANFRVHRRSFLRSARYDDDDPIEPHQVPDYPGLHLSLLPIPCSLSTPFSNMCHVCETSSRTRLTRYSPFMCASSNRAYLSVKLAHQPAIDLVLVASPNGPHLRLLKQSMAIVVFSLRPVDRLAIVTYSSAAARVFPLRCMTSYGKRSALQVIDRIFHMGQADPIEGLKKGVKILEDRVHENPESLILHLSDSPTRLYHMEEVPVTIHRFHVGFGFGTSNGFVMHEFEEFLGRILGGALKDVNLRIGEDAFVSLGEIRGVEERRIPITLNESRRVCVKYSYLDAGIDECRTGEMIVEVGDKRERDDNNMDMTENIGGRTSSVEGWDYHDPFMARRWAKHLHDYRG